MQELARLVITVGVVLIILGLGLSIAARIPFLGKLPGDFLIQKKNVTLYVPLATSLVISVILSFLLWLWSRR